MIKKIIPVVFIITFICVNGKAQSIDTTKYIIQNDIDVAKEEPGTHA